ncbi:hypothetical protein VNO77_18865 [Canavalia gladiata]|uniref:Uncharacterized protein n=1 Tax=Canavalia gladiata TaxID=3824 RepID=A0AAN9LMB7_CANGL
MGLYLNAHVAYCVAVPLQSHLQGPDVRRMIRICGLTHSTLLVQPIEVEKPSRDALYGLGTCAYPDVIGHHESVNSYMIFFMGTHFRLCSLSPFDHLVIARRARQKEASHLHQGDLLREALLWQLCREGESTQPDIDLSLGLNEKMARPKLLRMEGYGFESHCYYS